MKRVDLVKKGSQWVAESGGKSTKRGPLKTEAIKKTAGAAEKDPEAVSLKIHLENGRIQEERTYPRKRTRAQARGSRPGRAQVEARAGYATAREGRRTVAP
jgi:hypothetical protein